METKNEMIKLAEKMSKKYCKPFVVVEMKLSAKSKKSFLGIQCFVNQTAFDKFEKLEDGSFYRIVYMAQK